MEQSIDLTNFQCIQCHACCKEKDYVRLTTQDILSIAQFMDNDPNPLPTGCIS